jgi:hypothetical protein
MNDSFELIATYQEKKKLYKDKAWELINELLASKPIFKTAKEKREFLRRITLALLGQGLSLNQAYKRIEEAGFATSYNRLSSLITEEKA